MELEAYLAPIEKAAVHFTGEQGSTLLLYELLEAGCDIHAFFIKSAFVPDWKLAQAEEIAKLLLVNMTIIYADLLSYDEIAEKQSARCHECQSARAELLVSAANQNGFLRVLCAASADEDEASCEYLPQIEAPFAQCGIDSEQIKARCREANLPIGSESRRFCLAEQLEVGKKISGANLWRVEHAENALWQLGFRDYRVKKDGGRAIIEMSEAEYERAVSMDEEIAAAIRDDFKAHETTIMV